jgi:hypothetical protein
MTNATKIGKFLFYRMKIERRKIDFNMNIVILN